MCCLASLRPTATERVNIGSLQWRHNGRDGVSNHQPYDYLLNRLFRHRSKKTAKLRVTGLCAGNSPVTGEFPAQMASNAEIFSIWWRHHVGNRSHSSHRLGIFTTRVLDDRVIILGNSYHVNGLVQMTWVLVIDWNQLYEILPWLLSILWAFISQTWKKRGVVILSILCRLIG